jgi:hypothetical protein
VIEYSHVDASHPLSAHLTQPLHTGLPSFCDLRRADMRLPQVQATILESGTAVSAHRPHPNPIRNFCCTGAMARQPRSHSSPLRALCRRVQVKALRVKKLAKFGELKEQVEAELGVAVSLQRYWMWAWRQNHTLRLNRTLTPIEDTMTLQEIKTFANCHVGVFGDDAHDVKLYLEENLDAEGRPQPLPWISRDDALLFFKFYDAARGEIHFVGKTFVHLDRKFTELKDHMCAMAGLQPDAEIKLFEVSSRVACAPCALMNFANRRITRIRLGEVLTRQFHHARHVPHQSPVLGASLWAYAAFN